jgi:hypothetical protein
MSNRSPYELLHHPTQLVIDVKCDDLGHPDNPQLWEQLRSRPIRRGELQCLTCIDMGHGVQWVHLVQRSQRYLTNPGAAPGREIYTKGRTRFPRHFDKTVREHVDMTPEHRIIVDRVGREVERFDRSLSFDTEVDSADRSWRADLIAYVDGRPRVNFEAQFSPMGLDKALERNREHECDGLKTIWTPRNDRVPWARGAIPAAIIPAPDASYLARGEPIPVIGGARRVVEERCGWDNGGCPTTGDSATCHRTHLYLEAVRTQLGALVARLTLGAWDTIRDRAGNRLFVTAEHALRWRDEYGEGTDPQRRTILRQPRIRAYHNFRPPPAVSEPARPADQAAEPELLVCSTGCGVPLHPAAAAGGFTTHPGCDDQADTLTRHRAYIRH